MPNASLSTGKWIPDSEPVCRTVLYLIALVAFFVVLYSAWLTEDCFVTLRHVSNMVNGHGPVFNVGERVQGYTHPLWFLLLVVCSYIIKSEMVVALGLGLLLTAILLLWFGRILIRNTSSAVRAVMVYVLAIGIFISSDAWVSFQTSGLENPLAHLLILAVLYVIFCRHAAHPAVMILLLSLLCLTRPDYVFFCLPFGLLILPRLRSVKTFGVCVLAVVPALAWLSFAYVYYGSPLPNTGSAKLAAFPTVIDAVLQGVKYVIDWCIGDPLAAVASAVYFLICLLNSFRSRAALAVTVAVLLHLIWVISFGGGFMRGRFLLPVLTSCVFGGSFVLLERLEAMQAGRKTVHYIPVIILFAAAFGNSMVNAANWSDHARAGVINERKYYRGYSLRHYLSEKELSNPYLDLNFADDLRRYAESFGTVTIHLASPGTMGYLAGPGVIIIDLLGLTDPFIASLGREYHIDKIPRPGHVAKYIPVSYLASKTDVSLLPDWEQRIREMDSELKNDIDPYKKSTQYWSAAGMIELDL